MIRPAVKVSQIKATTGTVDKYLIKLLSIKIILINRKNSHFNGEKL